MPDYTTLPDAFPAYVVRSDRSPAGQLERLALEELPGGDVLIEVDYSSLNYKDALASQGHPGVVRQLPHIPGIDCAGRVLKSDDDRCAAGTPVLVTGYGLGSEAWGGYSGLVRVPAEWVVSLPSGLSPKQAMTFGTAGFTAAQSVDALLRHGLSPDSGPLLVTGATGGVGGIAVAILAKLGFEVVAMTGKQAWHEPLMQLGASRVIGRDDLADDGRPMLSADWAGGVDTVGGDTLAKLIRSTNHRGCVACCGLVAGVDLPLTVYPFILRGVTLAGIDSAKCPREPRLRMWENLAGPWKVELPEAWIRVVTLDGLQERIDAMLAGDNAGRVLVQPTSESI